MSSDSNLIEIKNLKTYFHTELGTVKAVDDLTVSIKEGHTLGLVGESGSGKSVTSLTIMQLLPSLVSSVEKGSHISFLGKDLLKLSEAELRKIRRNQISMIFQDPMTSLNPVLTTGYQVMEAIILHQKVSMESKKCR